MTQVSTEPRAWLVRGGRTGERDQWALDTGVAGIGFHEVPTVAGITDSADLRQLVRQSISGVSEGAAKNYAAQLNAFVNGIAVGDTVVLPIKNSAYVAVGRVTGAYTYGTDPDPSRRHVRKVDWIRTDVPRSSIGQDLLYSLGAFLTVCEVKRNDASWRLLQIMNGAASDPGARTGTVPVAPAVAGDLDLDEAADAAGFDVLRYSQDRIIARIRERFDGHRLTDLVAHILEAEGFRCTVSPPGRDGGVDILAGMGVLGMDAPRLVVQVKSQPSPVSDTVLQQLHGAVMRNSADQGLIVAMGGLTKPAQDMLVGQHFKVAVWNSDQLLQRLFEHYRGMPEDIQADLPLQRAWVLIEDSGA